MKGVPPPALWIPARREWGALDRPKLQVKKLPGEPTDEGLSDQGKKKRRKTRAKRRAKSLIFTLGSEEGNFRELVQQYTGSHKKGPDKFLSDDDQPDNCGSVCDVAPPQSGCPASPLPKEQIPQRQRRKLPEPFAGRTIKSRVHSKSSSVPSKHASCQEQEPSEADSEYPSRPLPLPIETQRNQADIYVNATLSSLPATGFRAEYFVELKFSGCSTTYEQAWLGRQRIGSLRVIDFSHSNLKNLPDLSEARQARSLILQGCKNLANVSCIRHLAKLEHLNLKGCTKLTGIPTVMQLKLLSSVDLSHCRNLKRLPPSIGCLSGLASLNLRNCRRLENLPVSILRVKSLQSLDISGCSNLMKRAIPAGEEELCPKISAWEKLDDEMVFSQTPSTKAAINYSWPGESSFEGENSAATLSCQDLQEQMPALEFYMNMSVEAIHLAGAFQDIEQLVADSWFHQTCSLQKMAHLRDTMCFLEEVKGNIPRTMECMRSARTRRRSLREWLTHVAVGFIEAQGECLALDAQLTMLSDEEARLDAEMQVLISRKEELLMN